MEPTAEKITGKAAAQPMPSGKHDHTGQQAAINDVAMKSRYVDAQRHISTSNSMVILHSHMFFEILCCQSNCNVDYLVGAERYRLQKGDIILIPPGVSHRPLLPEHMPEPFCRDALRVSQEVMSQLQSAFFWSGSRLPAQPLMLRTAATQWEFLQEMFRQCVREYEQQQLGWEEAVLGITLQLLPYLHRGLENRTATPLHVEKPELLDQVLAYVEEHLAEKISLADVAKQFWVSQSTISQTFRNKMGVSFYRCVTQRRLIAAKSLILQGIPLEQINERVGFMDYSTFYRAFKQEYGLSPRQFRKLQELTEN